MDAWKGGGPQTQQNSQTYPIRPQQGTLPDVHQVPSGWSEQLATMTDSTLPLQVPVIQSWDLKPGNLAISWLCSSSIKADYEDANQCNSFVMPPNLVWLVGSRIERWIEHWKCKTKFHFSVRFKMHWPLQSKSAFKMLMLFCCAPLCLVHPISQVHEDVLEHYWSAPPGDNTCWCGPMQFSQFQVLSV